MVRFILNFIFFGVLFYAISLFFPDAFQTLVSWAGKVYSFIVNAVTAIINWVSEMTKSASNNGNGGDTQALSALLMLPMVMKK